MLYRFYIFVMWRLGQSWDLSARPNIQFAAPRAQYSDTCMLTCTVYMSLLLSVPTISLPCHGTAARWQSCFPPYKVTLQPKQLPYHKKRHYCKKLYRSRKKSLLFFSRNSDKLLSMSSVWYCSLALFTWWTAIPDRVHGPRWHCLWQKNKIVVFYC